MQSLGPKRQYMSAQSSLAGAELLREIKEFVQGL